MADPQALAVCNAAKDAYDFLGSPEGELAIAQAVVYLATAPKSNAVYTAFGAAMQAAKQGGSLLPPKHILNSPTKLMKSEGYGSGYQYDHDMPDAFSGQDYFPEALGRQTFYDPPDRGFEREIRKRLDYWERLRKERAGNRVAMLRFARNDVDGAIRDPARCARLLHALHELQHLVGQPRVRRVDRIDLRHVAVLRQHEAARTAGRPLAGGLLQRARTARRSAAGRARPR